MNSQSSCMREVRVFKGIDVVKRIFFFEYTIRLQCDPVLVAVASLMKNISNSFSFKFMLATMDAVSVSDSQIFIK